MFTKEDIAQIEQRGTTVQTVADQVERFKKGFPWMKIVAPATPEKGIKVLDADEVEDAVKYYEMIIEDCTDTDVRNDAIYGIVMNLCAYDGEKISYITDKESTLPTSFTLREMINQG